MSRAVISYRVCHTIVWPWVMVIDLTRWRHTDDVRYISMIRQDICTCNMSPIPRGMTDLYRFGSFHWSENLLLISMSHRSKSSSLSRKIMISIYIFNLIHDVLGHKRGHFTIIWGIYRIWGYMGYGVVWAHSKSWLVPDSFLSEMVFESEMINCRTNNR